jgi:Rrf2 family transcriptional regulator, iron-sulfur cluster assembly transcription factor
MFFSKSFGYAVRSILYIALVQDEKRYVQAEEIALNLGVPRHFIGKILKKLAKANVLLSVKGPNGGFRLNDPALRMSLLDLHSITDGAVHFQFCALRIKHCSAKDPCPLHGPMNELKGKLQTVLAETALSALLKEDRAEAIRSISSEETL